MQKEKTENNSKLTLAIILIVIGAIWLFKEAGFNHLLPWSLSHPLSLIPVHISRMIFSWQVILILVGLALIAGNRNGWPLIILGGIFLLPKIFLLPAFSLALMLPIVLIVLGIVMIIKKN